jgi:transposase InsO family protein
MKDASTGEIVASYVSDNLRMPLVTETVSQLLKNNDLLTDTIVHSDQGVHYTSPMYQKLLKDNSLTQSMSRRGNCWDNAPMESFFGHMKDEVDFSSCGNLEDIKNTIDDF